MLVTGVAEKVIIGSADILKLVDSLPSEKPTLIPAAKKARIDALIANANAVDVDSLIMGHFINTNPGASSPSG